MARIRTIKPEFWTSDQVTECSRSSRLLFIGMWNFCDDKGRHVASVKRLKGEVFPCDDIHLAEVNELVDELLRHGLIQLMKNAQGVEYWQVTGWHHQVINKPQKEKIQEGKPVIHVAVPECYVTTTAGKEGKGRDKEGSNSDMSTYHLSDSPEDESGREPENPKPKKRQRRTYPKEFSDWYRVYPKPGSKRKAEPAYYRAVKVVAKDRECSDEEAQAILKSAAEAYAKSREGQDPQYTKLPATWLNGGCWDDEITPAAKQSRVATAEDLANWRP